MAPAPHIQTQNLCRLPFPLLGHPQERRKLSYANYPPEKLKKLRIRSMLTQGQVVELTGICVDTLVSAEKGHRRPRTSTLEKLLNLYAIRIQTLERIANVLDSEPPFSAKFLKRSAQSPGVAGFSGNQRGPYKAK